MIRHNYKPNEYRSSPVFGWKRGGVWKRRYFPQKIKNISEIVWYTAKLQHRI